MSKVKAIPDGYHSVTPYIVVKGAAKLIDFLKRSFDAQQILFHDFGGGHIHAEVRLGDSVIMMGEPVGEYVATPAHMYLYVNDADAAYRRALQAGATSLEEPSDKPYGDRSAGVKDPFGNVWWIAMHKEDLTEEEVRTRMEAAAGHA